eukprot:sb/3476508/
MDRGNEVVNKLVKLHPKTRWNLLVSRTLQLRDLRSQVCSLLEMLVPDLDQNELGVKNESVDGPKLTALLKQVLEANNTTPPEEESETVGEAASSECVVSSVKTEVIADAQFLLSDD